MTFHSKTAQTILAILQSSIVMALIFYRLLPLVALLDRRRDLADLRIAQLCLSQVEARNRLNFVDFVRSYVAVC